jgi:hypothetical protein
MTLRVAEGNKKKLHERLKSPKSSMSHHSIEYDISIIEVSEL